MDIPYALADWLPAIRQKISISYALAITEILISFSMARATAPCTYRRRFWQARKRSPRSRNEGLLPTRGHARRARIRRKVPAPSPTRSGDARYAGISAQEKNRRRRVRYAMPNKNDLKDSCEEEGSGLAAPGSVCANDPLLTDLKSVRIDGGFAG